jgi:NTE family protein
MKPIINELSKDIESDSECNNKPTIKHLVLSGGGTYGLVAYGALKETNISGFWDMKNIESCYCTSVGSIIAVIILLGYDWETLDTFFIKRPWNEILKYNIYTILNSYENCGVFNCSVIADGLKPLILGADLSMDITMKEFFDITNVRLNIYTGELNSFKLICISHITHPDWKLIDAIYASSCLPCLLKPLFKDESVYIDGGLFLNYPISECLKQDNIDQCEIFGINKTHPSVVINASSNLIDYIMILIFGLITMMKTPCNNIIDNEIIVCLDLMNGSSFYEFANSEQYRQYLIQTGVDIAKEFLHNKLL